LANCYNEQDYHDQNNHVLHYHPWCDFPRGYLSTQDNAELKLANLDPIAKTVDVLIRNPSVRVLGYEFNMGGLTIQSVQNLAPNLVGEISMNSSLGGTKVIGLSYIDSSLVKSAAFQPLCRITYLSLTGGSVCIASIDDIVNEDANNVITAVVDGCLAVPNTVSISPKVWLDGAYEGQAGLMRDDLRIASLIPASEPYTALGFTHAAGGGNEQVNPAVFATTGNDAIVDWVLIELRDVAQPYGILATRSALLQRDGDIVAVDGISPVQLQLAPGNYHVAILHRNHFGIMTASPVALGSASVIVDLRSSATGTWGTDARKDVGGTMAMWAGNTRIDRTMKYTGLNNDRDPILVVIGGVIPTGTVVGYYQEDTNLSGLVKYTGLANDRDLILQNIGGVIPTNSLTEQLP
jgi:hypothetical protein